jgi:RimJ/RimL family protein N-acetyltransferase
LQLHDLYSRSDLWVIPYQLLDEREPKQNISHREMPTWQQHCNYIGSRPHAAWYWFTSPGDIPAGCVYLSKQREIGIGVLKAHRGQGLGKQAVQELMCMHPGRVLANINPANTQSARLFHSIGFKLIQVTYSNDA